ncbi:MAG: hypothetical protein AAB551_03045 [Patescibacteria group bacterium]
MAPPEAPKSEPQKPDLNQKSQELAALQEKMGLYNKISDAPQRIATEEEVANAVRAQEELLTGLVNKFDAELKKQFPDNETEYKSQYDRLVAPLKTEVAQKMTALKTKLDADLAKINTDEAARKERLARKTEDGVRAVVAETKPTPVPTPEKPLPPPEKEIPQALRVGEARIAYLQNTIPRDDVWVRGDLLGLDMSVGASVRGNGLVETPLFLKHGDEIYFKLLQEWPGGKKIQFLQRWDATKKAFVSSEKSLDAGQQKMIGKIQKKPEGTWNTVDGGDTGLQYMHYNGDFFSKDGNGKVLRYNGTTNFFEAFTIEEATDDEYYGDTTPETRTTGNMALVDYVFKNTPANGKWIDGSTISSVEKSVVGEGFSYRAINGSVFSMSSDRYVRQLDVKSGKWIAWDGKEFSKFQSLQNHKENQWVSNEQVTNGITGYKYMRSGGKMYAQYKNDSGTLFFDTYDADKDRWFTTLDTVKTKDSVLSQITQDGVWFKGKTQDFIRHGMEFYARQKTDTDHYDYFKVLLKDGAISGYEKTAIYPYDDDPNAADSAKVLETNEASIARYLQEGSGLVNEAARRVGFELNAKNLSGFLDSINVKAPKKGEYLRAVHSFQLSTSLPPSPDDPLLVQREAKLTKGFASLKEFYNTYIKNILPAPKNSPEAPKSAPAPLEDGQKVTFEGSELPPEEKRVQAENNIRSAVLGVTIAPDGTVRFADKTALVRNTIGDLYPTATAVTVDGDVAVKFGSEFYDLQGHRRKVLEGTKVLPIAPGQHADKIAAIHKKFDNKQDDLEDVGDSFERKTLEAAGNAKKYSDELKTLLASSNPDVGKAQELAVKVEVESGKARRRAETPGVDKGDPKVKAALAEVAAADKQVADFRASDLYKNAPLTPMAAGPGDGDGNKPPQAPGGRSGNPKEKAPEKTLDQKVKELTDKVRGYSSTVLEINTKFINEKAAAEDLKTLRPVVEALRAAQKEATDGKYEKAKDGKGLIESLKVALPKAEDLLRKMEAKFPNTPVEAPKTNPSVKPKNPEEKGKYTPTLSETQAETERGALERDYRQSLAAFRIAIDKALDADDRETMAKQYKVANGTLAAVLRRMDEFVLKQAPDNRAYVFGSDKNHNVVLTHTETASSKKNVEWFKAAFGVDEGKRKYADIEARTGGRFAKDFETASTTFDNLSRDNIVLAVADVKTISDYLERGKGHIARARTLKESLLAKDMDSFESGRAFIARIDAFLKQKPIDMAAAEKRKAELERTSVAPAAKTVAEVSEAAGKAVARAQAIGKTLNNVSIAIQGTYDKTAADIKIYQQYAKNPKGILDGYLKELNGSLTGLDAGSEKSVRDVITKVERMKTTLP